MVKAGNHQRQNTGYGKKKAVTRGWSKNTQKGRGIRLGLHGPVIAECENHGNSSPEYKKIRHGDSRRKRLVVAQHSGGEPHCKHCSHFAREVLFLVRPGSSFKNQFLGTSVPPVCCHQLNTQFPLLLGFLEKSLETWKGDSQILEVTATLCCNIHRGL